MEPQQIDSQAKGNKGVVIGIIVAVVALAIFAYYWSTTERTSSSGVRGPSADSLVESPIQEKIEFLNTVREEAATTTTITLTNCKADPEIAKFKMGSTIVFSNKDALDRMISFTPQHSFKVPANGKLSVKFNFFALPGIRKYTCNQAPSGVVSIIK
jgi:hypothetical protein